MDTALEFDLDAVLPFVRQQLPGLHRHDGMTAIGLRRGNEIVAGVIYEGFNKHNIWVHVVGKPGGQWLTRRYLRACLIYPFEVARVSRIGAQVEASNSASRRLTEHLGFVEEARLKGAAQDGGDVILYVMRREDCKHVEIPPNRV